MTDEFKIIKELQSFGLTQAEILNIKEEDREVLLEALIDCEERDIPYGDLIYSYVRNYSNFAKFEEFLRPKKFR